MNKLVTVIYTTSLILAIIMIWVSYFRGDKIAVLLTIITFMVYSFIITEIDYRLIERESKERKEGEKIKK